MATVSHSRTIHDWTTGNLIITEVEMTADEEAEEVKPFLQPTEPLE